MTLMNPNETNSKARLGHTDSFFVCGWVGGGALAKRPEVTETFSHSNSGKTLWVRVEAGAGGLKATEKEEGTEKQKL